MRYDNLNEKIKAKYNSQTDSSWSIHTAPIKLEVPVYKVLNWKMDERKSIIREDFYPYEKKGIIKKWNVLADSIGGSFFFTPQIPDRDATQNNISNIEETITLVPYGCTKLRITIFPQARYNGYTKIDE